MRCTRHSRAPQEADHRHRRLLRARRERPRRCAAEQRYELAAPHHSITSSARASNGLHYSALRPLNLTTLAHFSVSSATSLAKSADEPVNISLPSSTIRAFAVGSARAALISRFKPFDDLGRGAL